MPAKASDEHRHARAGQTKNRGRSKCSFTDEKVGCACRDAALANNDPPRGRVNERSDSKSLGRDFGTNYFTHDTGKRRRAHFDAICGESRPNRPNRFVRGGRGRKVGWWFTRFVEFKATGPGPARVGHFEADDCGLWKSQAELFKDRIAARRMLFLTRKKDIYFRVARPSSRGEGGEKKENQNLPSPFKREMIPLREAQTGGGEKIHDGAYGWVLVTSGAFAPPMTSHVWKSENANPVRCDGGRGRSFFQFPPLDAEFSADVGVAGKRLWPGPNNSGGFTEGSKAAFVSPAFSARRIY